MFRQSGWLKLKVSLPQIPRKSYSAVSQPSPIRAETHAAPHSGNIRVLLLDRLETRNALSRQLTSELTRHVDEIQAEQGTGETRAVVIASNVDKAFCAGADLKERKDMTQAE
jgi:methylglutaconyl-CoA hydratase